MANAKIHLKFMSVLTRLMTNEQGLFCVSAFKYFVFLNTNRNINKYTRVTGFGFQL